MVSSDHSANRKPECLEPYLSLFFVGHLTCKEHLSYRPAKTIYMWSCWDKNCKSNLLSHSTSHGTLTLCQPFQALTMEHIVPDRVTTKTTILNHQCDSIVESSNLLPCLTFSGWTSYKTSHWGEIRRPPSLSIVYLLVMSIRSQINRLRAKQTNTRQHSQIEKLGAKPLTRD